ncbi:MAG: SDR family oxidoreductase [Jiangellaceae bacterium]
MTAKIDEVPARAAESVAAKTRRVLVTGASRGIGKAIALALAAHGFDLALAARTLRATDPTLEHTQSVHHIDTRPLPGSIEETAELVARAGRRALPLRMDLTDLRSVESAVDTLLHEWGGADAVVHNGRHLGPGFQDTVLDTPIEQYPLYLMAHGVAPNRITQMLLPGMLDRGNGAFVTITSAAASHFYPSRPRPGLGYRIGKAAGHTLVGSLVAEYGDRGITGFNVDPGYTRTERNSLDGEEFGMDPSAAAPAEAIGAAVAWLLTSPDARARQGGTVDAQALALELGLYPDWRSQRV